MSSTENYNKILNNIYYDPAGFGSIISTFKEAFKQDKTITLNYVRQWFKSNLETTKQVEGSNSFVAPYPYYENQLDLMFFADLKNQNKECYVLISLLSMLLLSLSRVKKKMI
jgi:hypothetical protein